VPYTLIFKHAMSLLVPLCTGDAENLLVELMDKGSLHYLGLLHTGLSSDSSVRS
jgi:hypothetical protein